MDSSTSLVDVGELRSIGDPEFLRQMVDLFLETVGGQVAVLRTAAAAGDTVRLARVAHTVRGASLGMFANAMATLAAALERAGKDQQLEGVAQLLTALDATFAETSVCMREAAGVPAP
jgi:HPt (histidine-containing phosphotransfer) domain-containing protein